MSCSFKVQNLAEGAAEDKGRSLFDEEKQMHRNLLPNKYKIAVHLKAF